MNHKPLTNYSFLFSFRRFFIESYIDQKDYNQKQQIQKGNIIGNFSKLTHNIKLLSFNFLAIIKDIILHVNFSISNKNVNQVIDISCVSIKTTANQPADKLTKRSESISNQFFILIQYFNRKLVTSHWSLVTSSKGFSQILIMIVLGVILLGAGLIYTNPFKNSSEKTPQASPTPSSSPLSQFNETQQELINNKEYLMRKNNLTEEGFDTYLKMAKDEEF